jgi:hypothetical protein
MITVFHANEFSDNTKGYTKVAEVDVDTINEAFELTNNIDGSWSRGPEFEFDGDKIVNGDYDPRIKVTTDLVISKRTGEPMGLRSTSRKALTAVSWFFMKMKMDILRPLD